MFLPLSSTIAGGRAVFAAAVMASSAAAHVHLGGMGFDLPSLLIGFLLLVGVAWSTNRPAALLAAAVASQFVLHVGGAFTANAHTGHLPAMEAAHGLTLGMMLLHSIGAVAAWLLLWRFEVLWRAVVDATHRLTSACTVVAAAAPVLTPAFSFIPNRRAASRFAFGAMQRRGPPVFA